MGVAYNTSSLTTKRNTFWKVLDSGTSIPAINLQHCRAFVKMEQRKPFRFDECFPHLRQYRTINSTDAKGPITLLTYGEHG